MKAIQGTGGTVGPFINVEQVEGGFLADGVVIPLPAIGHDAQIIDYVPPPPTVDEFDVGVKAFDALVQKRLDDGCRSWGYGDPNKPEVSPALFLGIYSDNPAVPKYQQEAQALKAWIAQTWRVCELALRDITPAVLGGERPAPEWPEIEALLPEMPERPQVE